MLWASASEVKLQSLPVESEEVFKHRSSAY